MMKKLLCISISYLFLMSGFVYGTCEKPPQGPRGPTGATGAAGSTGATGATGSTGYFSDEYALAYTQTQFAPQNMGQTFYNTPSTINLVEFNSNGVITDGIQHGEFSSSPSEFEFSVDGWYLVNWVYTLVNYDNSEDVNIQVSLLINGTPVSPDPYQEFYLLYNPILEGGPYQESFAGYSLIPISEGDVLELGIVALSNDDGFSVALLNPRISIVKINAPLPLP